MAFDVVSFLKNLTTKPGVYRMLNGAGDIIYVGKAKNLQKRVSSYFQKQHPLSKTGLMVAQIASVEVTVAQSEVDALILEADLIKQYRPKYNILLRDDKSYPYIYIATEHEFPRIDFVRGKKKKAGRYFGPYPTLGSAREILALLQKCFLLRQCRDSVFRHRSRPCLQYQIKRCQGPCVGLVEVDAYQQRVQQAIAFLEGKSQAVIDAFIAEMRQASEAMDYERAARLRDEVEQLRLLQHHQAFHHDKSDADVLAVVQSHHQWVVVLLMMRSGQLHAQKTFYPKVPVDASLSDVLLQFVNYFYLSQSRSAWFAPRVLLPINLDERAVLEEAVYQQVGRRVSFIYRADAALREWRQMAQQTAEQMLQQRLSGQSRVERQMRDLAKVMGIASGIERIECFDISHTQGEATKASCVVFDQQGPAKKAYRQFDIKDVAAGDDYAAMRQAVYRRYSGLLKRGEAMPELVLIDGGKGQLQQAVEVFQELQIDSIQLLAVAKGVSRKPGLEKLIRADGRLLQLAPQADAFRLIQFIRDESHRFGIRSHRKKRDKARKQSVLEGIAGVGPKRRQELLTHFGGLQGLQRASVSDIAKVKGVSLKLAEAIKRHLQ